MITEASVEGLELLESLLKSIKEMKRMANYCYSIETREEVGKLLKVLNDTKALLTFLQDQNDGTIVYVLEKLGRGDFKLSDLLLKRETTTQRDVP